MGILNVTPDSFSDGGLYETTEAAVAHGLALHESGADLVDVGGESTRPGAARVDAAEEQARVVPVVRALADAGVTVSIDTMRASTASAAVEAGASLVNDVSGGLADPAMLAAVADLGVGYVAMHWRGHSDHMDDLTHYPAGVARGVAHELAGRLEAIDRAGIDRSDVVLDPGLGFAKNADQNWELLRDLDTVRALGVPLLIGASRKRFLSAVGDRDVATHALTALLTANPAADSVWGVRVHDVAGTRATLAVVDRMQLTREDRA